MTTYIPQKLPVKRTDYETQSYIVQLEEKDYAVPLYPFQLESPQPESLNCLVQKDETQQVTRITQDVTTLLQSFYHVGQSYLFRLKSILPVNGDHYELEDDRGFTFNLYQSINAPVTAGQNIRCQVREISSGRLSLDFQNVVDSTASLEKLRLELENKATQLGPSGSTLVDLLFSPEHAATFDRDIDRWLMHCVESHFPLQQHSAEAQDCIERIIRFCLFVLEDSTLLRFLHNKELSTMQDRLDQVAALAESMSQAIRFTLNGEADTQVQQTIKKLSASGYLFDAQRKLQTTDYLLTINPSLFAQSITALFDIITKRDNANIRQQSPFPFAFMRMLEHYIQLSRELIDSVNTMEDNEETQNRMSSVIKALAIQQLLALGHDSVPFNLVLNRSRLYRYLSFLPGVNAPRLLEQAYRCLINGQGEQLEFGWDALSSDLLIAMKVNNLTADTTADLPERTFITNQVTLLLGNDISLQPTRPGKKLKSQLPYPNFLPWHHMDVRLSTSIHIQQMQDKESLRPYEGMWKNIERHLFVFTDAAAPITPRNSTVPGKHLPEEGDIVTIRITHPLDISNSVYHCVIVDRDNKGIEGEGELNAYRDVVSYNWMPTPATFQDERGLPLLLEARVAHVNEATGQLSFDLREPISQAIIDDYNDPYCDDGQKLLNYSEEYLCVITNYSPTHRSYAAVSSNGLTFTFKRRDDEEQLPNSTYVRLRLLNRARTGNGMHEAELVTVVTDTHFLTQDAVNELLQWYSCGEVWTPTDGESDATTLIAPEEATTSLAASPTCVAEFMRIIDRLAVVTTDYKLAYNYLGFIRLVALTLNDQQQADYYSKRMKFILTLKYFETNGTLDDAELQQAEFMSEDVVRHYQGLHMQYLQLRCVSYMRQPQFNAELWNTLQTAGTSDLGKLARLVLAYNLLGEFRQQQGQILVHKEINRLLGIKERESELRNFGEEDFHTEFKTSVVFPPDNNMRPDPKRQTENILHVICGFLNAEGGKLYLGVNNEGMGTGLANDAQSKLFNNGKNFRDSFGLYIINSIRRRIGTEEAMNVETEWVEGNGRDIFCLTIKPSSRVARIEGRCWRRIGTESVELRGETLHRFMEQRATELRNTLTAPAEPTESSETPAAAPASSPDPQQAEAPITAIEPAEIKLTREQPIRAAFYPRYEGAYAKGYVNIIDRFHYMHTDDAYLGRARITIPVYEGMDDPHLLLVYTDGTALRVPVSHIFDQQERQTFSLYKSETDIDFAAIIDTEDLLLTTYADRRGRLLSRCDAANTIATENSLNARGQSLVNEGIGDYVTCVLINEHQGEFRRLRNLSRTTLGYDLSATANAALRQTLTDMGLAEELKL